MADLSDAFGTVVCSEALNDIYSSQPCTSSSFSTLENVNDCSTTQPIKDNKAVLNGNSRSNISCSSVKGDLVNSGIINSNCVLSNTKEDEKNRLYIDFYSRGNSGLELVSNDERSKVFDPCGGELPLSCEKAACEDSLSSGIVSDEEIGRSWSVMGLTESTIPYGTTKESDGSDSGIGSDVKADSLSSDDLTTGSWEAPALQSAAKPKSMLKRPRALGDPDLPPLKKKPKRSIAFGEVDVFYFPRAQGFTCVPSQVIFLIYTI